MLSLLHQLGYDKNKFGLPQDHAKVIWVQKCSHVQETSATWMRISKM